MNLTYKKSIIAAILGATLAIPVFVSASTIVENQNGTESVTVSIADLNLNIEEGRWALQARLKSAANRVCHTYEGRLTLEEKQSRKECFNASLEKALNSVGINNAVGMVSS